MLRACSQNIVTTSFYITSYNGFAPSPQCVLVTIIPGTVVTVILLGQSGIRKQNQFYFGPCVNKIVFKLLILQKTKHCSYHSDGSATEHLRAADGGEVGDIGERVHDCYQADGDPDGLRAVPGT